MAQQARSAIARLAMCGEQHCGIDFEMPLRVLRHVAGGHNDLNRSCLPIAKQNTAAFRGMDAVGFVPNPREQVP